MAYPGNDPPSTGMASATTSVGGTATAIPAANLANRLTIMVFNNGTDYIYVGASGVTSSTGIPIPPGGMRTFDIGAQVTFYCVAASGSQDVRTLEQS